MEHLHSVMLGDAGWVAALLIGLTIESRLTKTARRSRDSAENSGPGWLTPQVCPALTKNTEVTLVEDRHFT